MPRYKKGSHGDYVARQLADQEARVTLAVTSHYMRTGRCPTYSEILGDTGLSSKSLLWDVLNRLKAKGIVDFELGMQRTIRPLLKIAAIDRHVV